MKEMNISETDVFLRTIRRFVNSKGVGHLHARKKGFLIVSEMMHQLITATSIGLKMC